MASSAAKTGLMFMLLLAAVVAAHGQKVSCKNNSPVPVTANGIEIAVGVEVEIDIVATLVVEAVNKLGKVGKCSCIVPADVTALVFVYVNGSIQVKVAAVSSVVGDLLHTVVGLILCVIKSIL
jgi:hypothetical protein